MQLIRRVETPAEQALPGEAKVRDAAHASLDDAGGRGVKRLFPFLGPAFVASVAYVDPGNFATNVSGGAQFGYTLLWVIVSANLMAMLVQSLSAKLGIATGRNLAEVCRDRFPRVATVLLWIQAEAIAIATDIAEFLGAALALNLLFHIPLFPAGILTAFVAFGVLALQQRGIRKFEAVIAGFVAIILLAFGAQVVLAQPAAADIFGGLKPAFDGTDSLLLAVGILGATVMPHVIYLHSSLTQHRVVGRSDEERKKIFRFEVVDVVIALSLAGIINASMLITAAAVLHDTPYAGDGDDLVKAANALGTQLGSHADVLFGIALLASGLSSSSVGTLAGQVIMQGFLHREIPLFLRRAVTMTPALFILAIGVDPTSALVISQVVLSFGIPFALVPLLWFCSRRDLMGGLVNRTSTTVVAATVATVIIVLNVVLLYLTFTGA
ncbi:MAG: Nramp family divalent metal transporter [Solirubrobacteraceae bacterium]|nr:Nramp family divalent metal transporter [Solirubrobacteraceae bacterium]